MHKLKQILAALAATLACTSAPAQEYAYVEPVHCIGGPFGLNLPRDARKIRSMGRLLSETVAEVEHWDGYTATRKTLAFDGLDLGIIELSNDPSTLMVTHADVSSPRWNHLLPVRIGEPAAAAHKLLGEAAKDDKDLTRVYGGDADGVQFRTQAGLITRVTYQCYSG